GRQQGPGDAYGAEHVDVVHALPVVQIRLGGGLDAQRAAGDVDERVQGATEQLVHALDQACDRVVVGDVDGQDVAAGVGRELLQALLATGDGQRATSVGDQTGRGGTTDPGGGAGDDRGGLGAGRGRAEVRISHGPSLRRAARSPADLQAAVMVGGLGLDGRVGDAVLFTQQL